MTKAPLAECAIPEESEVFQFIENPTYSDCYRTDTSSVSSPVSVYWAIFGNTPSWVQFLMLVRNKIAIVVGLKHFTPAEIEAARAPVHPTTLEVGQRAGVFTVLHISDNELVLGDDDKHLNFRISVFTEAGEKPKAYIATVVSEHNLLGRVYMIVVKPIHRIIAPYVIRKAIQTGRLK